MKLVPHPEYERILRVVRRLRSPARRWTGKIFRCVTPSYANEEDLLSGVGAQSAGGRWNPLGAFPVVYGSLTPETALAEVLERFRTDGIPVDQAMPRVLVAISVRLGTLLDLTRGDVRQRIRVSRDRIVGTRWSREQHAGREAITQAIGRAAYDGGLEAVIAPSSSDRGGSNLAIFADNLGPSCRLEVAHAEAMTLGPAP